MNVRKKIKKVFASIFSMLIGLSSLPLSNLQAANHPIITVGPEILKVDTAYNGNSIWGQGISKAYADGNLVYCIEPATIVGNSVNYKSEDLKGFDPATEDKLIRLSYYGYGYSGHTSDDWYAATQIAIWRAIGGTVTKVPSAIETKITTLNEKADSFYKRADFGTKSITLKGYGESNGVTLNDKNKVFNEYHITDVAGLGYKKSGNTLKIWAKNGQNGKYTFKVQKADPKRVGASIMYSSPNNVNSQGVVSGQDLAFLPVSDPGPLNLTVNVQGNGTIQIIKIDEDGNRVPNTTFKLSKNADMSSPIGSYTTTSDGAVKINDIAVGKYYIQETSAPNHLVLNSTIGSITVEANKTTTYTATNDWVKGKIAIRKTDEQTGKQVANATYAIYNAAGQELERLVTTATGYVESGYLRFGKYTVKEVIAPDGYLINDTVYPITVSANEQMIEVNGQDKRVTAKIELSKRDKDHGNTAQGDATLENAKYGLFAREDILDPADKSVIYRSGTKIAERITKKDGSMDPFDNLYLGKYYVQELEASNGYLINDEKINVDLLYAGQTVPVVMESVTSLETVKKQAFEIIKISSDGSSDSNVSTLQGAEFTYILKEYVDMYGSFEKALAEIKAGNTDILDSEWGTMTTDKKGYAISKELPFGSYIVSETIVPAEHYKVNDFTVIVSEDSRDPQPWRIINDAAYESMLQIIKQDAETGKTVLLPNTTFKIYNLDKGEYVEFFQWTPLPHVVSEFKTNETGMVYLPKPLKSGNYQLEEIKAPNGYLLNKEPIKFKVTGNNVTQVGPDGKTPVLTVYMKDVSVKGKIKVEKRGEVLTGVEQDKDGNMIFKYEEKKLPNATFEVYADEDVFSADKQGDIIYTKGSLVDTVTTGSDGVATTKDLPLGKYKVVEKTAPDGFVINASEQKVELEYVNEETSIVFETVTVVNERQKASAQVTKKDADENIGLSGAVFGLYTKEDIKAYDGTVLVKANTLIEKSISDENGVAKFLADLPLVNYEVKELKAPIGYSSSKEIVKFDARYKGQDLAENKLDVEYLNKIIQVEISKTDIATGEELPGNHLTVFEKDNEGAIVDTWVSTDEKHLIKGLEIGKTYVLRETSSAYGFAIAKDVEFTIEDTREIQKVKMENPLVMGQLSWNKTGEIFDQTLIGQTEFGKTESPVWNKSNLLGAEITIYAAQDIKIGNHTYYREGEVVEKLESDWEATLSKKLPVGRYYYKETKAPHGYIMDTNRHYFEVEDNQINEVQIITATLQNERPKVEIDMLKTLEEQEVFKNPEAYKDIVFGIFAREDIYDYMGNVAIENGTMIYTSGINEKGHLVNADTFDLPNGVYYIKELSTNGQYVLNDKEYDFEIAYHGEDVSKYTVQIGEDGKINNELARGNVKVQKIDTLDRDLKLEGIAFHISADADMKNIIKTEKTDKEGIASFTGLELGTYYIQEAKQIDGYVLNDHIYQVEVTANGDILEIECENKPTEMIFSKVGETGSEELEGAKLQIIEKSTGTVIDEWISEKEPHLVNYLVEGKEYLFKEVSAPYGYEVAEAIDFTAGDGQKITMKDKLIRSFIDVMKIDSTNEKEILKIAEFTLYEDVECTKAIKTIKTDPKTGIARANDLIFGTYYIKETKAPAGYKLSDEVIKVTIDENWINGDDKTRMIKYENTPLPGGVTTGDTTNIMPFILMFITSGLFVVITSKKKGKAAKRNV